MTDDKSFREQVQRNEGLVQEIEGISDPALRATTKLLMQSLMDLHGAALERALEIVAETGDAGFSLIDKFGRDPMVSSVLVLYGLHPEELDTRIANAIERVRPQLRKQGCELEVVELKAGVVRLRVQTPEQACGSTGKTVQATLEGAIYDAAPDLATLTVEGLEGKAASGFVGLDQLTGAGPASRDAGLARVVVASEPLSSQAAD
jgi:Fe-S cluster biogenesis protein NfuA